MGNALNRTDLMNVNDLTKLTVDDLRRIKNKNFLFFNSLVALDLIVFYHSLFSENWILLFFSFGFFVASLALYDNYRLSREMLERSEN
jgi:hypothetical protein